MYISVSLAKSAYSLAGLPGMYVLSGILAAMTPSGWSFSFPLLGSQTWGGREQGWRQADPIYSSGRAAHLAVVCLLQLIGK